MSRQRFRPRQPQGASATSGPAAVGPPAGRARRRWWLAASAAALLAPIAFVAWWSLHGKSPAVGQGPGALPGWKGAPLNVLIVTLDTTRADHLGSYGSARARTRHMDRLAAEGARFALAYSPAPITLPAHASLMTGLYPFAHMARNNGNFFVSDRLDTIATRLKARGYRTGAFVGAFVLDRRYGLARGFDTYDDRMEGGSAQVVALEAERRGDRTALALGAWLDRQAAAGGAPWFAWLHLYDPHEPYRPPQPFRSAFADAPYDGEIAFADAIVASVVDRLGRLGLLDSTLIVIAGDHGESLGEHGEETHSMLLYEGALRVPLIIWRPGLVPAGTVVADAVRLTDVPATILELVGAPPIETPHGRSLVPLMAGVGDGPQPPVYAETLLPELYMGWAPLFSIRDERFKLIVSPLPELFDLDGDPREQQNVAAERPQTAGALGQQLDRLMGSAERSAAGGRMDRETIEKLAALGYVGAAVEQPGRSGQAREASTNPREAIGVFNRLRRANSAVRERRYEEALPILHEVLDADPRNAFAQLVLGSAYMGRGDYARATEQFRRYLALVPSSSYAHLWIAICQLRLGAQDEALAEADAALAIDPRFSDARVLKGGVLASRGRYELALTELRVAVETDPAKPILRLDLARTLADAGRPEEAARAFEAILAMQEDYVPALTGLGALHARRGDYASAEELLRRALAIDAGHQEARYNLAGVLVRRGRIDEARAELERILASPETTPALKAEARSRLRALKDGAAESPSRTPGS